MTTFSLSSIAIFAFYLIMIYIVASLTLYNGKLLHPLKIEFFTKPYIYTHTIFPIVFLRMEMLVKQMFITFEQILILLCVAILGGLYITLSRVYFHRSKRVCKAPTALAAGSGIGLLTYNLLVSLVVTFCCGPGSVLPYIVTLGLFAGTSLSWGYFIQSNQTILGLATTNFVTMLTYIIAFAGIIFLVFSIIRVTNKIKQIQQ
jgi:hypothetical protein